MTADAFAGGGTDGRDDQFPADRFELLRLSFLLDDQHHMINLCGIGHQHHLHLPVQNLPDGLLERSRVFRERPAVDGD